MSGVSRSPTRRVEVVMDAFRAERDLTGLRVRQGWRGTSHAPYPASVHSQTMAATIARYSDHLRVITTEDP